MTRPVSSTFVSFKVFFFITGVSEIYENINVGPQMLRKRFKAGWTT